MKKVLPAIFFLISCNATGKKAEFSKAAIKNDSGRLEAIIKTDPVSCDQNYDSILSIYIKTYHPVTLDLNKSISDKLKSFLLNTDTNCLRRAKNYKLFIATIISKQALYELKCCNQNYDLLQMDGDAAKFIVNDYIKMAGYGGQQLEMLNSGTVDSFILNDATLKQNIELKQTLGKIEKEGKRIERN